MCLNSWSRVPKLPMYQRGKLIKIAMAINIEKKSECTVSLSPILWFLRNICALIKEWASSLWFVFLMLSYCYDGWSIIVNLGFSLFWYYFLILFSEGKISLN